MAQPDNVGALLWNPELDDPELAGEDDSELGDETEVGARKAHNLEFPAPSIPKLLSLEKPARVQTVRWGDKVTLTFPPGSVSSPGSEQFSSVQLPQPMVCNITFHAEIMVPILGAVSVTVLSLFFGVGSANYRRDYAFSLLPAALAPIDFTIESVPLQSLQAQVAGVGFGGQRISATLSLAPVSGAAR